jgi:hypothetical protein
LLFLIPVWGEKYISVMLEGLLLSLLSPNNFPILSNERKSVLCIISNTRGINLINDCLEIKKCQEYLDVRIINGEFLIDGNKYSSMTRLYLLGLSSIKLDEINNVIFMTPDMFCSDGTILRILDYLKNGVKYMFVLGLRVVKADFLSKLQSTLNINLNYGKRSKILELVSNRDKNNKIINDYNVLTQIVLSSLHPITKSLNVIGKFFNNKNPSHLYWIGEGALIAHGFHWHPLLVSYSNHSINRLVEKFQNIVDENKDTIVLVLIGISILLFLSIFFVE